MQRLPAVYFYPLISFLKEYNLPGVIFCWELAPKNMIVNFALWNTTNNLPVAQNKSWAFYFF